MIGRNPFDVEKILSNPAVDIEFPDGRTKHKMVIKIFAVEIEYEKYLSGTCCKIDVKVSVGAAASCFMIRGADMEADGPENKFWEAALEKHFEMVEKAQEEQVQYLKEAWDAYVLGIEGESQCQ